MRNPSSIILTERMRVFTAILAACFFMAISCRKDLDATDTMGELRFSTDTVTFDTVFTTIGSTTLSFKVYNPGKETIRISSISLAGGNDSFFRLNIDGEPVRQASNVDIPPDDSLFIFVAVTIDPTNSNNPNR